VSELELRCIRLVIARVFGAQGRECGGYRIAPDEWIAIGDDAHAVLATDNPLAVDFSSGFVCLELAGSGWEEAFAHLSDLALPEQRPAVVQGPVAEVAAKAVVGAEGLLLLVPPQFAHHVREEILALAYAGFAVEEVSAERTPA
jgi:hypothetical protein